MISVDVKVKVKIDDKEIELTYLEAQKLMNQLNSFFGKIYIDNDEFFKKYGIPPVSTKSENPWESPWNTQFPKVTLCDNSHDRTIAPYDRPAGSSIAY